MFLSPEKLNLSEEEVNKICEILWKKRDPSSTCPDCNVKPNKRHKEGCDVAICTKCGAQRLCCDCKDGEGRPDIWTGIWPGIKECYEQKLICFDTATGEWIFDLNTLCLKKSGLCLD